MLVVAFQSTEESLCEIFCSLSNIWDHSIIKAEKNLWVVGCHANIHAKKNKVPYTNLKSNMLTKHLPTHSYTPPKTTPMDRLVLLELITGNLWII